MGVSLYEMGGYFRPHTRPRPRASSRNLIQSRRPPRALPASCPTPLRAIISKALAADIGRRYPSAADFEKDLIAFLDAKSTQAELEKDSPWDNNETIEKSPEAKSFL